MLKKIVVAQWVGGEQKEFDYSEEKRNELINQSLKDKLHLMMYEGNDDTLIMYIDTKRFRQR